MKWNKYFLKILTVITGMALTGLMYGQKGIEEGSKYGKGKDSVNCVRNTSLYREYAKLKSYNDALKYWIQVFRECPYSSKNIYIDGAKIYKYLAEKEQDPAKRTAYVDTLMMVYDFRLKNNFGEAGYVNQYKGLDLLALESDNVEAMKNVYSYFKLAIEDQKEKTITTVFQNFIKVGIILHNQGALELPVLIEDFIKTIEILEKKGDANLINEINDQMVKSGIIFCEQLISVYTPKFEANPNDTSLLVTITDFLDKLNCEDSEFYYKTLSERHRLVPTATSAKMLTVHANKKEKFSDAIKYAEVAISMESDNVVKTGLYLQLAYATNKNGNKSLARTQAYKAAKLSPTKGEPYLFIGSLYAESNEECSDLPLPKSIYWVAVDKFVKAKQIDPSIADKAEKSISIYSEYYPNKEEAFFQGVKEGESFKVECWINESTTARFNQ